MDAQKQIEEMARDICECYHNGICYQDDKPCDLRCDSMTDAEYLHDKGYRKASEVALEVIGEVEKIIDAQYNKHIFGNNDLDDIEKDAIINFSDDISNRIDELKELYEEQKDGA